MADDNSQDYSGYDRASDDSLEEEPKSTQKDKQAPDLTDGNLNTGITKEEEVAMGLRTPDGRAVQPDLNGNDQTAETGNQGLDEESEEQRGGDDEAANNPGLQNDVSNNEQDGESSENDTQQNTGAEKDPKDWVTGDEDATPAQMSYISTMAVEAKEEVPTELTKAQASEKIHELQQKTGRDDSTERP